MKGKKGKPRRKKKVGYNINPTTPLESLLARSAFNIFKLLYCVATGVDFTQYTLWKGQVFFLPFFLFFFLSSTVSWIFTRQTLLFQSRAFVCRSYVVFFRGEKRKKKKKQTLCYFHKLDWNPKTVRHDFFFFNLGYTGYITIVNLLIDFSQHFYNHYTGLINSVPIFFSIHNIYYINNWLPWINL